VAHVTQCRYCIRGHTDLALKKGATEQEIMEAIWVAAEMRAGSAYAHSILAIDAMRSPNLAKGLRLGTFLIESSQTGTSMSAPISSS
jgi:AhpD family alkylhydroperoxidase